MSSAVWKRRSRGGAPGGSRTTNHRCDARGSRSFFVLAGATFVFGCCQRSRSSFVSTSLGVACKFIRTNFMLYFVAVLMGAVAYSYSLCWTLAEFGIYYHLQVRSLILVLPHYYR